MKHSSSRSDKSTSANANGVVYNIFQLVASGKIKYVDDGRGHYYRVSADEITKEEFELEKTKRRHAAAQTAEDGGRE